MYIYIYTYMIIYVIHIYTHLSNPFCVGSMQFVVSLMTFSIRDYCTPHKDYKHKPQLHIA